MPCVMVLLSCYDYNGGTSQWSMYCNSWLWPQAPRKGKWNQTATACWHVLSWPQNHYATRFHQSDRALKRRSISAQFLLYHTISLPTNPAEVKRISCWNVSLPWGPQPTNYNFSVDSDAFFYLRICKVALFEETTNTYVLLPMVQCVFLVDMNKLQATSCWGDKLMRCCVCIHSHISSEKSRFALPVVFYVREKAVSISKAWMRMYV